MGELGELGWVEVSWGWGGVKLRRTSSKLLTPPHSGGEKSSPNGGSVNKRNYPTFSNIQTFKHSNIQHSIFLLPTSWFQRCPPWCHHLFASIRHLPNSLPNFLHGNNSPFHQNKPFQLRYAIAWVTIDSHLQNIPYSFCWIQIKRLWRMIQRFNPIDRFETPYNLVWWLRTMARVIVFLKNAIALML